MNTLQVPRGPSGEERGVQRVRSETQLLTCVYGVCAVYGVYSLYGLFKGGGALTLYFSTDTHLHTHTHTHLHTCVLPYSRFDGKTNVIYPLSPLFPLSQVPTVYPQPVERGDVQCEGV